MATELDRGTLSFSVESRILRELGERLVKQPEVAIVELVKNSYDADAGICSIARDGLQSITVKDDGSGMTLDNFRDGWMRIGTSSKEPLDTTPKYGRFITGEKGIGRFAVRFLGRVLHLETVAHDPRRRIRTKLVADFDWPRFDKDQDLGKIAVPYRLYEADKDEATGTTLVITRLRSATARLDLQKIRTGTIGILTPIRSLFREVTEEDVRTRGATDPGFILNISIDGEEQSDVAAEILEAFVLRAKLELIGDQLALRIYRRGKRGSYLKIRERFANSIGNVYADIRFFPRRAGAFRGMPVDGRRAYSWIVDNSGVAVFDRNFRIKPYGSPGDDWLSLQADAARNRRDPRSSISSKHFPMSQGVRGSTSENWMLRLPQSAQLIGLVQVEGRRHNYRGDDEEGLIASADREGFVENRAFRQLQDVIRGAVEAIAFADRKLQLEEAEEARMALLESIRVETRTAIEEVRANPRIGATDKARIVSALTETRVLAERQEESAREREQQLEVMSLLGIVAGYMSHEFGIALKDLEAVHEELVRLAERNSRFREAAESFENRIKNLKEFVTYSSGYIQGAKVRPSKPFPVRPRLQQVKRYFGRYAEERGIDVEIGVENDLLAPLVPPSLYNGIALNLYTNALKAVTAKIGSDRGTIAFRAWNDGSSHYLEVSDTGVGIPSALHNRVFDPLFTTTESRSDPLGSGMGLGLALVRRGAEAFGGKADIVKPPAGFSTCVRVRLPLSD